MKRSSKNKKERGKRSDKLLKMSTRLNPVLIRPKEEKLKKLVNRSS